MKLKYPFQLKNAFFISLQFKRSPRIAKEVQLEMSVQLRIHGDKLPERLQVDIKVEAEPDQPAYINTELVGLFDLVEGQPAPDEAQVKQFVNERALFMLYPIIHQMIRQTSVTMGMSPLDIKIPYYFGYDEDEEQGENRGVLEI